MRKIALALLALGVVWGSYLLVPPPQPARAQFAAAATFITVGGSANVVTATVPNISAYADLKGVPLWFLAASANTGPTTLNINNWGAVNVLRINSLSLGGGELQTTVLTSAVYTGTAFLITSAQDTTPVGTAIQIRGASAPTGYLIEDGSCVSQTTYAALFAVLAASYGSCSAGQFALPDSRGTLFAALDTQGTHGAAGRITNAVSGCTATTVPFSCGGQSQLVSTTYLPASGLSVPGLSVPGLTYSGTASFPVANLTNVGGATDVNRISLKNNANTDAGSFSNVPYSGTTGGGTTSGGTTGNMGSGTAMPVLNPILGGLRAVKY